MNIRKIAGIIIAFILCLSLVVTLVPSVFILLGENPHMQISHTPETSEDEETGNNEEDGGETSETSQEIEIVQEQGDTSL